MGKHEDKIDLTCVHAYPWANDPKDDICGNRQSDRYNHLVIGGCWYHKSCPGYEPRCPTPTDKTIKEGSET